LYTSTNCSRVDRELDERMRDAFHRFIEERGVNENLFDFLQAWMYVKEHRGLMRWFKTVGTYINENRPAKNS
jgi:complement component 1 Q subcomponent-binding protein